MQNPVLWKRMRTVTIREEDVDVEKSNDDNNTQVLPPQVLAQAADALSVAVNSAIRTLDAVMDGKITMPPDLLGSLSNLRQRVRDQNQFDLWNRLVMCVGKRYPIWATRWIHTDMGIVHTTFDTDAQRFDVLAKAQIPEWDMRDAALAAEKLYWPNGMILTVQPKHEAIAVRLIECVSRYVLDPIATTRSFDGESEDYWNNQVIDKAFQSTVRLFAYFDSPEGKFWGRHHHLWISVIRVAMQRARKYGQQDRWWIFLPQVHFDHCVISVLCNAPTSASPFHGPWNGHHPVIDPQIGERYSAAGMLKEMNAQFWVPNSWEQKLSKTTVELKQIITTVLDSENAKSVVRRINRKEWETIGSGRNYLRNYLLDLAKNENESSDLQRVVTLQLCVEKKLHVCLYDVIWVILQKLNGYLYDQLLKGK